MSHPDVSILIPVYNRNVYIGDCIQSALNQTFSNVEVVIVDNASTDGTWEICQKFAALDDRVRIFRNQSNIGPVRNWIRCAQEARGKYSKILFSDDLLEPECIERMIKFFKSPDVGIVFCAAKLGESREASKVAYYNQGRSSFDRKTYLKLLLAGRAPVSPGAVLLRTQDLLKNLHTDFPTATPRPFDRHGAGSDVMLSLLTTLSYPRVAYISEPLVYFRMHSGSLTIANAGNEVSSAYISILAYYLRNNEDRLVWSIYVTRAWLSTLWRTRKWTSLKIFLKAHEGDGSVGELVLMSVLALYLVPARLARWMAVKEHA